MHYINRVKTSSLKNSATVFRDEVINKESSELYKIKKHACCEVILEYLEINDNDLILEGHYIFLNDLTRNCTVIKFIVNDDKVVHCETLQNRSDYIVQGYNKNLSVVPFSAKIPNVPPNQNLHVKIELQGDTEVGTNTVIDTGPYFPFCTEFNNAYIVIDKWIVKFEGTTLVLYPSSKKNIADAEQKLCEEYMSLHDREATKAVFYRQFYNCYKAVNNREIWLISDQWYRADDNGEALFSYLSKNKTCNQDVYFVLSKNSKDYERLSSYGRVIEPNSYEHRLYRLLADKICFSHAEDASPYRIFSYSNRYYQDILCKGYNIFLQHGITQNNVSDGLNRYSCKCSLLTVGGTKERDGFISGQYFYDENVVKITGMARFDNLIDKREKTIVIMPTWRKHLAEWSKINIDGTAKPSDDFTKSDFYIFYNKLLNDAEFIGYIKKKGYRIKFMPHPNIRPVLHFFDRNDAVEFCAIDTPYRDLFAEGSLLVTDYSSVAFDFAYLNKPVVYCQFDREYFFSEHYQSGYFDYEKDGFGEVVYDIDSTIDCIAQYINNHCKLKDNYQERIKQFFQYNDQNNCKRIYDEIVKLDSSYNFKCINEEIPLEDMFDSIFDLHCYDDDLPQSYMMTYKYVFPCHLFKHTDKVVIYGAGKVGSEFYFQNMTFDFVNVVAVIDKKSDSINVKDLLVENIDVLSSKTYDYVLLAVLDENLAKVIKEDLIKQGIDEKKIKWDGKRYSWLDFFAGGGFDELVQNVGCR